MKPNERIEILRKHYAGRREDEVIARRHINKGRLRVAIWILAALAIWVTLLWVQP